MADAPATPPTEASPAKPGAGPAQPAAAAPTPAGPAAPTATPVKSADAAKEAAKKASKAIASAGLKAAGQVGSSLKKTLISIVSLPLLIFKGDLSTRLLTLGFVASLVLAGISATQIYERFFAKFRKNESKTEMGQGMSQFLAQQKELAIASANVVYLDKFSTSITAQTGDVKAVEIEIFLECDAPETSTALRAQMNEAREIVSRSLEGQNYERLMTEQGKEELKRRVAKVLNSALHDKWNSKGKIHRVFLTRLLMG